MAYKTVHKTVIIISNLAIAFIYFLQLTIIKNKKFTYVWQPELLF